MSNFQYMIQAEGRAQREEELRGADIHNTWAVFHKNPDDKGLWTITPQGLLQITSNQNGLSGRYNENQLNATDYEFYTELIPSGVDDDSFGIHFRYQNNFAFYFVAWDGGGEYGWGEQTLRLYKVEGDVYKLLTSRAIGHWNGGQQYGFKIAAVGNTFSITIDGQELITYTDNNNPYLTGAYGPCATSQVTTWVKLIHTIEQPFLLSKTFDADVTIENISYENGKKLSDVPLIDILEAERVAYLQGNGYDTSAQFHVYRISTDAQDVVVYFHPLAPVKETTDAYAYPYAYLKYEMKPPAAPMTMIGQPGIESILWSWSDVSSDEDGFEILDQEGDILAVVSSNTNSWLEEGLEEGTLYTRSVRSYNQFGYSETATASAIPVGDGIVYTPDPPLNLRGVTNSTTEITWYWDSVENADSYELYKEDGTFILSTTSLRFKETGLEPDTEYKRYVLAKNVAGLSGKSNIAIAFTDIPQQEGDVPDAPLNLTGEAMGPDSILWQWEAPAIEIPLYREDGSEKEPEEIEEERQKILNTISYRVYDQNGEVLYEAPPNNFEFHELNLSPDTAYTHYIRAFNQFGESVRSNSFYVKTEAIVEDGEEDETNEPEWPIEKDCEIVEQEPQEKIKAFKSGIGDNLDLKVRVDNGGEVKERFAYDLQIKGIERVRLSVFDRLDFSFRFRAEGIEKLIFYTGEYLAKIRVFPRKEYQYDILGEIEVEESFSYRAKLDGRISDVIQNPINYTYQPFANVVYHKTTNVTTASMFNSDTTKGVYGPNTWQYYSDTDMVKGLENVDWSGAYSTEHLDYTDYEFECDLGVIVDGQTDNDSIGVAFRINKDNNGNTRMYYFMCDRRDSSGMGLGGVWRLGKTRNQSNISFTWPLRGEEVIATNKPGWMYNEWYNVRVQVTGSRIRIWVDGDLVVDVVDEDPAFSKGAFGPTNYSQIGCSFKNFKVNTTKPEVVKNATTYSDSITDVYTSSNKKQLSTQTAASLLSASITKAFNDYKAQNGSNSTATLEIIDYGIERNVNTVEVSTTYDGTGYIYAFPTVPTRMTVYDDFHLDSPVYSDTISEKNTASNKKELKQTINGTTKAHTTKEIMAPVLEAYTSSRNISSDRVFIDSYSVESLSEETTITADANGNSTLKADTISGTIYKGTGSYQGYAFEHEGWKEVSVSPAAIVLTNKDGDVYGGPTANVNYTLVDKLNDAEILVVWRDTELTGARKGPELVKVKATKVLEAEFDGIISATGAKYLFPADIIPIPDTEEYENAEISIQKLGGHDNTFLYFNSDKSKQTTGEEIRSYRRDVVVIDAGEREVLKAWAGYTEWYKGNVNGVTPYRKDADGRLNLMAPIEVITPDSVEVSAWFVELDDPSGTVTFTIQNGSGNKTTVKDDIVIFTSDLRTDVTVDLTWYGPKIIGETIYEVKNNEVLEIKERFLSPYRDAVLNTKVITDWKLIVISKNPNVEVWEVPSKEPWPADEMFIDVHLKAQVVNQTQGSWNPLIHNGYYYFNQQEYFLYADTKVKGKYTATEGFQEVEFPYTVKVFTERTKLEEMVTWLDTNMSDFDGSTSNTRIDISPGDIVLTNPASAGYYQSSIKDIGEVKEWGPITWEAEEPDGSKITMEMRAVGSNWVTVENGSIIPLPLEGRIYYKANFEPGHTTKDVEDIVLYEYKEDGDIQQSFYPLGLSRPISSLKGYLELREPKNGVEEKQLIKLFSWNKIRSFGTITYVTDEPDRVRIATVSNSSGKGVWDGTGDPIIPLANLRQNPDGSITGDIVSMVSGYLGVEVSMMPQKDIRDTVVILSKQQDFPFSIYHNLQRSKVITEDGVEEYHIRLIDTNDIGVFISPTISYNASTGGIEEFVSLEVFIEKVSGLGTIKVYTTTSDSTLAALIDYTTVPWDEVIDGKIQSPVKNFMRVRIDIEAGRTTGQETTYDASVSSTYSGRPYDNVTTDADTDTIKLSLPNLVSGYIESTALNYDYVDEWLTVLYTESAGEGKVTILTRTSNIGGSGESNWSAWEPLDANGKVQSPPGKYFRYRIEIEAGTINKKGIASTSLTRAGNVINGWVTTDTLSNNIAKTAVFTSVTIRPEVSDVTKLKRITNIIRGIETLSSESKITYYVRTANSAGRITIPETAWSPWVEVGPNGEINAPDGDVFQYSMELTPGFEAQLSGLMRTDDIYVNMILPGREYQGIEKSATSNYSPIRLKENVLVGYYSSISLQLNGIPLKWAPITLKDITIPEGTRIRVFTQSTSYQGTFQGDWTEATKNADGTYTVNSELDAMLQVKVQLERDSADISSPMVASVTYGVEDGQLKRYKNSQVVVPQFEYDYQEYVSPVVSKVSVKAQIYDKPSPILKGLRLNRKDYMLRSPKITKLEMKNTLYEDVHTSPVLKEVSLSAVTPSEKMEEEYGVTLIGKIPSDTKKHQVSTKTMKGIIDEYMEAIGVDQRNLERTRYSLVSAIPGIFLETKEDNAAVYYETGESEVYAYTTDAAIETVYSQSKVLLDIVSGEALITPIPQQGAPVIVKDATGQELTQVYFLDENGDYTLTNTENWIADGQREFTLDYANIDLDTLEIWVDEKGTGVYTKVEDYITCNNAVTTKYTYAEGTPMRAKYSILNSFYVDYNYNVNENYAMIKLHKPTVTESNEITVRYETHLTSAYYDAEEINLNPMQTWMNEGFIYITDEVTTAKKLDVSFNPSTLRATGYDRTTITVIAKDQLGNPVVGDKIDFYVSSGNLIIKQSETDTNGMATAIYVAGNEAKDVEVLIVDRTAKLEYSGVIRVIDNKAKPGISVELDKESLRPDGKDKLTITARIVDENQEPSVYTNVLFSVSAGELLVQEDRTNYLGEAYTYMRATGAPADGIITMKVEVPDLEITEYVNIRVNEVATIV